MRRLLLVFMIALLPLRGLVGDAMAVAMTTMPTHEHVQAATQGMPGPDHLATAAPAHEGTHGTSPHHAAHGDHSPADTPEHQHAVCDLCNGPAMTRAVPPELQLPLEHRLLVPPVEHFASSEPHRGIKPPIS
ncbi:hypothetical protein [Hydrogenophaga sp.]|uniref:hypothetical protein n=1 Tax=Hydrogenophaga sp. TaxID=1904254 RepID=UPI002726C610|nr:hypothetical protein [Hydrogenophaga sp.]MDO8903511.1 hypothetical protein [Hydrogenophaga sp.]